MLDRVLLLPPKVDRILRSEDMWYNPSESPERFVIPRTLSGHSQSNANRQRT